MCETVQENSASPKLKQDARIHNTQIEAERRELKTQLESLIDLFIHMHPEMSREDILNEFVRILKSDH